MGSMFGGPSSPQPRDLSSELGQISSASGPILDQERQFASQSGQDQLGLAQDYAKASLDMYPQLAAAERDATTRQRGGDLLDVGRFGSRYVTALNQFNPGWQSSLNSLNSAAQSASAGPTPLMGQLNTLASQGVQAAGQLGPSQLRDQLTQQAQSELAQGTSMTPEELRDVQQSSRAAYADRGITDSNPAMIGEVLARDQYGLQRQAQRQAFAGQTQQLGQSEDESLVRQGMQLGGFGQSVEGMNSAEQAQRINTLSSVAQTNQAAFAPVLGFYGRTDVSPTAGAQILSSAPNIINAGNTAMQPLLSYGSDLFNTNFNAQAGANINKANAGAAGGSSAIGAIGSIAGAAAMAFCWVAREVYGNEREPKNDRLKWLIFRAWLTERAPRWLYDLYLKHGPQAAPWLRTRPRVKRLVRWLMDRAIAAELAHVEDRRQRAWDHMDADELS